MEYWHIQAALYSGQIEDIIGLVRFSEPLLSTQIKGQHF
jgi:hypothetical protein